MSSRYMVQVEIVDMERRRVYVATRLVGTQAELDLEIQLAAAEAQVRESKP